MTGIEPSIMMGAPARCDESGAAGPELPGMGGS